MLKSLNGRFIIWGGVIVYIFLSCTPIAKKSFNYSSELEALSRLDLLPEFRSNCIVEQISSYDKTGGNDDGFNGTYSYIRKENNKLVIADLKGPGIINRIWTPTPTNDSLEFYFDGEKNASLKICFQDLFSNRQYPFIEPICGEGVGGFYCYLPIPYRKSCKIVLNGPLMKFYQIQYRYVDIIGYQLFVVNTVEKWMCFLLAYGRKPRFNVFNLILQEKCEFEVAK